jgi:RNA polymerase I-specific transcription initiation factor RRN3
LLTPAVPKNPPQIEKLPLVTESQLLDRLHQTLDYIMQVIPTAVGVLENIIDNSFPFDPLNAQSYIEFVTNLLRLTKYTAAIEPKVLRLIIEKLVTIDVELSIALEDKDKDDVEILVELARAEAENPPKAAEDEEDDIMDDDEEDLNARRTKISQASMIKLDTILNLLFERYTFIMTNELHRADTAFEQLVATFTRSILPAHNSHHCQYLLFRFCQQSPAMLHNFTATLLQIAFDRSRAIAVRSSAVSYLASLAARGARVESEAVIDLFNRLFAELDSLRAGYEVTAKGPDPERYRYYYTVFQACMYLFTFRWREFLVKAPKDEDGDETRGEDSKGDDDDPSAHRWLPGVREAFSEHIHGRVNPLKVCAPEVVNMFEVLCRHTAFLFLAPKVELNRRVRLTRGAPPAGSLARETALSARRGEEGLRLEGHYAFEPYLLPGGRRWVGGLYVNFEDVAPQGVLDEAASSDDEDEDDDGDE